MVLLSIISRDILYYDFSFPLLSLITSFFFSSLSLSSSSLYSFSSNSSLPYCKKKKKLIPIWLSKKFQRFSCEMFCLPVSLQITWNLMADTTLKFWKHTGFRKYSTKLLEEVLLNLFFIFPWVSGFDMGPQILKTKKKNPGKQLQSRDTESQDPEIYIKSTQNYLLTLDNWKKVQKNNRLDGSSQTMGDWTNSH
ncbi:hypothetical protein RIR_jg24799.t1 [Rhizophagus irregularis DAOM 181602=DAOM 197198]|nr:hypothetical protein RIR_jg24799.t1 [Rhizophagus irregularis DAOM 181602=DAOM 197198]